MSKSKFSHLIAEELANLKLKFNKKNSTRWNSILFMVRSVLKVTRKQYQDIQNKMPTATKEQRRVKKDFMLSNTERKMLLELKELLEMLEFATNELQTNEVSISRVYPQIKTLEINLIRNLENYIFTQEMRKVCCF